MRAIVADDSRLAASSLARIVAKVDPEGSCQVVSSSAEVLEACKKDQLDVAFLDIEMPGINGLGVAQRLKAIAPETSVVFVTGYPQYALDAWGTQASAFLVKPVDEDDVRRAVDRLGLRDMPPREKGLFVQCFGNFEVFFDGNPIGFERSQTKEVFAYLVDRRGALVTNGELMAVLWEDQPDTASLRSQLRTRISDLRRTLERVGASEVLVKRRGGVAVSVPIDRCDYYGFLNGNPDAINRYRGEYMCQYSWAEATTALLAKSSPKASEGVG